MFEMLEKLRYIKFLSIDLFVTPSLKRCLSPVSIEAMGPSSLAFCF